MDHREPSNTTDSHIWESNDRTGIKDKLMTPKTMSNGAASIVNIGSAIAVVAAVLTFWVEANAQSGRLADSISEVRGTISDTRVETQSTRDAVMMLTGKVESLAGSTERIADHLDSLDSRIRALEVFKAK